VGGDKLREGALSDLRVISTINARFEPVWVNIRRSAVPDRPAINEGLVGFTLAEDRRITGGFSYGFFVRSLVMTSDGATLLNPQSKPGLGDLFSKGHFSYAQVKPDDYLEMLEAALRRRAELATQSGR
jgi:hypothetical protein